MQHNKIILPEKSFILELDQNARPLSDRSWPRRLRELYGNECLITGLSQSNTLLEVHHIFARKTYPGLEYCLFNGIILTKKLHRYFHAKCGQQATGDQFIVFLDFLILEKNSFNKERLSEAKIWVLFLNEQLKTMNNGGRC